MEKSGKKKTRGGQARKASKQVREGKEEEK